MNAHRVRRNLGGGDTTDFMFREFTLKRFTEELLRLAYGHVQNTLQSDPRVEKVIAHSRFGVLLDQELVEKMLEIERARETMLMNRTRARPVWAFYQ